MQVEWHHINNNNNNNNDEDDNIIIIIIITHYAMVNLLLLQLKQYLYPQVAYIDFYTYKSCNYSTRRTRHFKQKTVVRLHDVVTS
jgi:hypothetical protein